MQPATPPSVSAAPADRLHALDALRALAMFLGVVLHSALGYMTIDVPYTPRMDVSRSAVFDVAVFGIHGFRMQAFFVVAGFFAGLLLVKRPPGAFLANRALRIGVPLLVGIFTVVPLVSLPFLLANKAPLRAEYLIRGPGHLWFLIYLSCFCIAAALWVAVAERRARGNGGLLARAAASPWAVLLMILPTTLLNMSMPSWSIETPWQWIPRPASLAYYGLFFATGFALHRAGTVAQVGRAWFVLLPLAILVFLPLLVYLSTKTPVVFKYAPIAEFLRERVRIAPAAIVQAAFTWSMVCGLLGLLMQTCTNPRPWVRWLADSSYWVYLIHLPIVYMLQYFLAEWVIPGIPVGFLNAALKFLLILVTTNICCLATYALLVRPTPLERIIGGSAKLMRPNTPPPLPIPST